MSKAPAYVIAVIAGLATIFGTLYLYDSRMEDEIRESRVLVLQIINPQLAAIQTDIQFIKERLK